MVASRPLGSLTRFLKGKRKFVPWLDSSEFKSEKNDAMISVSVEISRKTILYFQANVKRSKCLNF